MDVPIYQVDHLFAGPVPAFTAEMGYPMMGVIAGFLVDAQHAKIGHVAFSYLLGRNAALDSHDSLVVLSNRKTRQE
jgi:hypothetical protein